MCNRLNLQHKKTIYYNSTPDIRDGQEKYYKHIKFLGGLQKLNKFEVKTRRLQKHSTTEILRDKAEMLGGLDLCDACRPIIEAHCKGCVGNVKKKEKGIDVMIAIDMVNEAVMTGKYDAYILISGDADFVPALDLVEKAGKTVFSASVPRGYSSELRQKHRFLVLGKADLMENCFKQFEENKNLPEQYLEPVDALEVLARESRQMVADLRAGSIETDFYTICSKEPIQDIRDRAYPPVSQKKP